MALRKKKNRHVDLAVGTVTPDGLLCKTAEVRAMNGGDELAIGMSAEYHAQRSETAYRRVLLSRCVVKLGAFSPVTLVQIDELDPADFALLWEQIYDFSYTPPAPPVDEVSADPAPSSQGAAGEAPSSGTPSGPEDRITGLPPGFS